MEILQNDIHILQYTDVVAYTQRYLYAPLRTSIGGVQHTLSNISITSFMQVGETFEHVALTESIAHAQASKPEPNKSDITKYESLKRDQLTVSPGMKLPVPL